jgi:hypothetical protein
MQILKVASAGADFEYRWPDNTVENYPAWIAYIGTSGGAPHELKIAFGKRRVYGADRVRVLVLVDGYPHAEFFGADDIGSTGEVLSEIKLHGEVGEPICRYPDDPVPERYATLNVVGMPTRVLAKGVHSAWAVVANISDHKTMITLAALRRAERVE